MTRHYLDTTAQLERWTGDGPTRQDFRSRLIGDTHATSSHVLREWRGIVEGCCADVLNGLRGRETDLTSLFASLSQNGHGRKPGQRLRVLSLLSRGGEQTLDVAEVRLRAEAVLRYQSKAYFLRDIDEVRNGSECGLASDRNVAQTPKGLKLVHPVTGNDRCKKTHQICRQEEDLASKAGRLLAAAQALQASSHEGHKRMGEIAAGAVSDAREGKGRNCYGYLGDVSIALECRGDEILLTTDRSFDVMAPALGLTVARLSQTPGP